MKNYFLTSLALLALQAGNAHAQQTCYGDTYQTTPTSRFVLPGDGTALDTKTGLMWKRCLEGFNWNGSTCTGASSPMNWQNALKIAATSTFLGKTNWRVPNVKELGSIHERACGGSAFFDGPEVNLTVFPNMPVTFIWTSTTNVEQPTEAWGGGSGYQNQFTHSKTNNYGVLLVRDTP